MHEPFLCSYTEYESEVTSVSNGRVDRSFEWYPPPKGRERCFYCESLLESAVTHDNRVAKEFANPGTVVTRHLCPRCGWWHASCLDVGENPSHRSLEEAVGIAKTYAIFSFDVPLSLLRQFLSRHPENLGHVNPKRFEHLMGDCLRDAYAPCEVTHLGRSGDEGIDLKLITAEEETFLVQVKRRSNLSKTEGVEVVRSLNGVLFRKNVARGIVITSASRFTQAAHREAEVATPTAKPYEMHLLALTDVVQMLRIPSVDPYKPWTSVHWSGGGRYNA